MSLFKFGIFVLSVWCGGRFSRSVGFSPILPEILIGVALGPKVAELMPSDYAECLRT